MASKLRVTVVFMRNLNPVVYNNVCKVRSDSGAFSMFDGTGTRYIPWRLISEVTTAAELPEKAPDLPADETSAAPSDKVASE